MKVLYFAWLRSRLGQAEETIALPDGIRTVGQFVDWLKDRSPQHAEALADPSLIRAAVNQDFAGLDTPLKEDDELALFPPVTGG